MTRNRKTKDKIVRDMTLNLNKMYEWGHFENETLNDRTEEIPEVKERVKENQKEYIKEKKYNKKVR